MTRPWQAEHTPVVFPAKRCCAPGCGDKIKDGRMLKLTDGTGEVLYLEEGCVDWFVHGHPDYGCVGAAARLTDPERRDLLASYLFCGGAK